MAQLYEHDATSILPHLASNLPYSITCLRRIQHGQAYASPTAKILATFPPDSTPEGPWLAARVDLFLGRQTQIVLYSSLESHTSIAPIVPVTQNDGSTPDTAVSTLAADPADLDKARDQLLALMRYIKVHLLPEYLSSLPAESKQGAAETPTNNGVPLIPPPSPKSFLFGSLHTGLFVLLMRGGVLASPGADADLLPGLRIDRSDNPPYYKYFFPRGVFDTAGDAALPDGYRYHDRLGRTGVLPGHLDLVQSRTNIPRPREQLLKIPGVAVYHDGNGSAEGEDEMPIAWGFLGVDGAVATLHVEPEHRGKGLALVLSKQVMKQGMAPDGAFGAERSGIQDEAVRAKVGDWVHTEVAQYNKASRRVMEKIGGEVLTTVLWTVIELCD
ncbi:uncharacterized protein N7498_007352 [Penicillium cinerascens]|uniref:FR47-like domain-containing protein n=1 Tax=Penicillium cinerascens TaxID=70096 RepID=A0A9W9MDB1_9EURO|nr:uncharacterized protein N7498_007352 [Penicillium cinerascens]KAJ5198235.1 hypothetical protein N7498_007352 [Penicillium cinerascens]